MLFGIYNFRFSLNIIDTINIVIYFVYLFNNALT